MLRLTKIRKEKGLSAARLSRLSDINSTTLSLIETRGLRPYESQRKRIAAALGVADTDDLFEEVANDAGGESQ